MWSDPEEETQEAPSDPKEETQGAPSDPEEETQEVPSDSEDETQEALSDSEVETKEEARPSAGSTDVRGPVAPPLRKLTSSSNLPPNNIIAHVESTGENRSGRSSVAKFAADNQRRRRGRQRGERVGVQ